MYDTKFSAYKITSENAKFHKNVRADIVKQVNQAFREEGLSVGTYYSKADWHSPYYWEPNSDPLGRYASYDPSEKPELWRKFNQFVENQLVELVSEYGPIDILWLDGGWVNRDNHEFLEMEQIVSKLRKIQPDLLVVDRTIGGKFEDYVTPERQIPKIPPLKAWETNLPLAKNWGYVPNDCYKSFDEIIETIVKVVALGGNVILGIGPKPDGSLPEEAAALLTRLGKWLQRYGQAIYGTRPFFGKPIAGCYLTQKGNQLFIFYERKQASRTISLAQLTNDCIAASLVDSKEPVAMSEGTITLPPTMDLFGCVELVVKKQK